MPPKKLKDLLNKAVRQPYDDHVMGLPTTGGPANGQIAADAMRANLPTMLGTKYNDPATASMSPAALNRFLKRQK